MEVLSVQSKIKAESVDDVQAAVERMLAALHAGQPEGLRYAAFMAPDGETFVALREVDDGVENPLEHLPEYKELLEIVEGSRAAPPFAEMLTVIGSYRLF